jgi:hypothetical protein
LPQQPTYLSYGIFIPPTPYNPIGTNSGLLADLNSRWIQPDPYIQIKNFVTSSAIVNLPPLVGTARWISEVETTWQLPDPWPQHYQYIATFAGSAQSPQIPNNMVYYPINKIAYYPGQK